MSRNSESPRTCQVCGNSARANLRPGILAGPAVAALIRTAVGHWSDEDWICVTDLHAYRHAYVKSLLEAERGEVTALDHQVLESLREQETLARNPDDERLEQTTFGQRLADRVASFGGSWKFLILFSAALAGWIALNVIVLVLHPFDPYPFIFLNLMLSCLAAVQAPVIMMSQNRHEARDRMHAMHDYQVNLKAELEIRQLHQKLDHLLSHQWERLVEIQEMQMEQMNEDRGRSTGV